MINICIENIDIKEAIIYPCLCKKTHHKQKVRLLFSIEIDNSIKFSGVPPMAFLLPDDRLASITVTGTDAKGNPARVENVTFVSSNDAVATVDTNGLITPAATGDAQIQVTADALIGEDEAILTGILDVTVIAGQAVNLTINASLVV
jgi:hypothetical protein